MALTKKTPVFEGNLFNTAIHSGWDGFRSDLQCYLVWYYPEPEKLDLHDLFCTALKTTCTFNLSKTLFSNHLFCPEYGHMGGREPIYVKFRYPNYDALASLTIDYTYPRKEQKIIKPASGIDLYNLASITIGGTMCELNQNASYFPNSIGQFLWEHLSFNLGKYPDKVFYPSRAVNSPPNNMDKLSYRKTRDRFIDLIRHILAFDKRTDKSRNRPETINLVQSLISRYDQKTFSEPMLELWELAKDASFIIKDSRKISLRKRKMEELVHMYSIEDQYERIAKWKQV